MPWNHKKLLPYQILGGKTVKSVQINPQKNGEMDEKAWVSERRSESVTSMLLEREAELLMISKFTIVNDSDQLPIQTLPFCQMGNVDWFGTFFDLLCQWLSFISIWKLNSKNIF